MTNDDTLDLLAEIRRRHTEDGLLPHRSLRRLVITFAALAALAAAGWLLLAGFGVYDTMCNSSSCVYGDGVAIPGLVPGAGDELARRADGTDGSCTPCKLDADCTVDEICGAAGVCE